MKQRKDTTGVAHHHGRTKKTQPGSGRSLAASFEVSGDNSAKLRELLNDTDQPFKVETSSLSRKTKRNGVKLHVQCGLFEERLDVQYEVNLLGAWKSLRRYKRFTVGIESIATGEFVLVKHDGTDDSAVDGSSDWKAKVLEVRALDEEHVYIRVSWLNRPEDMAGGRQDYHGKNELVPTNQIDIIDAMTVNGRFDLKHWTEMKDIDPDDGFGKEVYYWRQTMDFTNQSLSERPGADGA